MHERQFILAGVEERLCIELSYCCVKEPSADAHHISGDWIIQE